MSRCGKLTILSYDEKIIAKYVSYCSINNQCDIEVELFHPFRHQRVYLKGISIDNVEKAVLDYMSLEIFCNTDDCNKLQAYEIVGSFKRGDN